MPRRQKKLPEITNWLNSNPIRMWRNKHFYTLEKLANLLETSRQVVYSWEQGKAYPRKQNITRLQEYTGITEDHLEEWHKSRPDVPAINLGVEESKPNKQRESLKEIRKKQLESNEVSEGLTNLFGEDKDEGEFLDYGAYI